VSTPGFAADAAASTPADEVQPIAIVAGHGEIAQGLVSAVAQITGRGELLLPVSNRGLGAPDIEQVLRQAVDRGIRVVFTDLPAGSCTLAGRRLLRDYPEVTLVTGVNLPVLVDFVLSGDEPPDAATGAGNARAIHAVERGRAALAVCVPPSTPARSAAPAAPTPPATSAAPSADAPDAPSVPPASSHAR
jgi:PTS system N-acetylgalactosamine-specific IIA component